MKTAVEFLDWCFTAGIEQTTWYGSSSANVRRRTETEVAAIHDGVVEFCEAVRARFGIVPCVLGDPRGLPDEVPGKRELVALGGRTRGDGPAVRVAVNYAAGVDGRPATPLDLVIRTGGQRHLSGFLPVESSFAELWFSDTLWPAFEHGEFLAALSWYARQQRPSGD